MASHSEAANRQAAFLAALAVSAVVAGRATVAVRVEVNSLLGPNQGGRGFQPPGAESVRVTLRSASLTLHVPAVLEFRHVRWALTSASGR